MARDIIRRLGGYNHPNLFVEFPCNEWKQADDEIPYHLDILEQGVPVLHDAGYRVCACNWSTGNPHLEMEAYIYSRLVKCLKATDAIGRHEYYAMKGFTTWNALRYRRVHEILGPGHIPFIIGEFGRDAICDPDPAKDEGGKDKPGWLLQGVSEKDYAAELLAYAAEIEKDNYVLGAVIYTFGPWDDFKWFNAESIVKYMPAGTQPTNYQPSGGGTVTTYHLSTIDIEDLRATLPKHATLKYDWRVLGAIKRIVIHHSATPTTTTAQQIASYHVNNNQWPGIGYHFVVTTDGKIQYVNDHLLITYGVANQNADTVHICLIGDFTSNAPPDVQIAAAKSLIDNYRLAMGTQFPIVGHRDIGDSSCPGDTWSTWKDRLLGDTEEVARLRAQLSEANTTIATLKGKIATAKAALG
jgi:hypothetical protein